MYLIVYIVAYSVYLLSMGRSHSVKNITGGRQLQQTGVCLDPPLLVTPMLMTITWLQCWIFMTSYAHPCRRSTARCQSAVHSTRHVINMHMQQLHANQHSSIADSDRRKTSVSLCSSSMWHKS